MSEVQSRPARGRSSTRGGRGAHGGARGPRTSKQINGDQNTSLAIDTTADEGELAELKTQYQTQLSTLKELFPDWKDLDLLVAVKECDGDLETTIERITEGNVSQFAEVKKTKDRSRSKVKDTGTSADSSHISRTGNRGRGGDSVRGRGRGTDRGRGGSRGGRGGQTNGSTRGTVVAASVPTVESAAWDTSAPVEKKTDEQIPVQTHEQLTADSQPSVIAAVTEPIKKTWAQLMSKPAPKPAVPKPAAKPASPIAAAVPIQPENAAQEMAPDSIVQSEALPAIPPVADELVDELPTTTEKVAHLTTEGVENKLPDAAITPSKDELTTANVEHLPDETNGPPGETVASTVASSKDLGTVASVATPVGVTGQAPFGRPGIGGYATTALKATSGSHRSASFQRRFAEQQEAVVLPREHALNQATVQFGSLGLNSDLDSDPLDVDEDREEAETRQQPPQHSPVAQPRAALPPAPRQAPPGEPQIQELPTTKSAPGLPPVSQQTSTTEQSSNSLAAQATQNQGSQGHQPYNQFGRYGQGGLQSETTTPSQKQYDPFGQQQAPQTNQYDYPTQQQNQPQNQQPSQIGGYSSASDAFASQYPTADQRSAYQNYYSGYGQQSTPNQQEAGVAQQRSGSAFGSGPNDSSYPQGQHQQGQGRYNDAQNSGHNTPNPTLGAQPPSGPSVQQGQHVQQGHGQGGQQTGNYPYNHPYYASPYYSNYMNQYGGYGQGGYGNFNKNMYGQPHHYGISPQGSYDQHSSSPANTGGFGSSSMHGREGGLGGGLGEYSRSASGTSQNQHGGAAGTAGGFGGGLPDSFGRQHSGYGGQGSYQQGSNEESLKPFGDNKSAGPSPSTLGAQPGRPGSATNNSSGQGGQGGLPQHSQQPGFGYPSHLQGAQGNHYGGLGGLGHQQGGHSGAGNHQGSYAGNNYGSFSGGGGYSNYNRGGWGTNYGQQH